MAEKINERQGWLVLVEIGSQRFSGDALFTHQIQEIIGNLKSHPKPAAIASHVLDLVRLGSAIEGAKLGRATGQRRRLAIDDVEVILFGEFPVAALYSLLKLAFANAISGFADQLTGTCVYRTGQMKGMGEEIVA